MPNNSDIAKLLLRLTAGILILLHGIHKIIYGIGGVISLVKSAGLPEFIAYGVYVGELIVPIFLILGLYARIAALFLITDMLMAIYLAYGFSLALTKHGALAIERPLLFLVMGVVIALLGSGKYSVNNK